jgi:hypothetical protein
LVIGLFANAAKGISSLQASRDPGIHAKTAFVRWFCQVSGLVAGVRMAR